MDAYTCLRCGLESSYSRGTWIDRHPVAVAVIAIAALLVVAATPWLLVVGALGAVAYVVDRGYRRRRALALRADWGHKVPLGMGRN